MLSDAFAVPDGSIITTDLCIIGAGPAGITLARECAGAGFKVCLLESGGQSPEAGPQDLNKGESSGLSYFALEDTRIRAFGGTSNHWLNDVSFRARPLDDMDFEARPGVPHSGWPFGRSELDAFYARAQHVCRLGPPDFATSTWEDPPSRPRLPTGERNLTTSVFQLGPTDTFCNYLGELAASDNVTLLLHANVAELATEDDPSRVSSVRVVVPGGRGFSVSARMYILAAGGLENARTLLLSNRTAAKGLGNRHDLVGRFFMEHLAVESGVLRPVDPALFERTGLYGPHRVNGTQIQAKLSVKPDVLRRHQLLNSTFFLGPMSEARASTAVESVLTLRRARTWKPRPPHLGAHVANILTHSGPIAVSTYRRLRGRPDDHLAVYQLVAMAEQAPNPYSRVTLSDRRDAFGLNRARLDWRLTELDSRSIRGAIDIIDDELRQAGLGRLERKFGDERPRAQVQAQWHHMGTTRMDRDERRGVVDPNCKVHGVHNLFVAGSSVFPTSGYANPTLTIVAMALRLADMVKTRFAQLDLPTVESR